MSTLTKAPAMKFLVETKDYCNDWSRFTGLGSDGAALALVRAQTEYRSVFKDEDEAYLLNWMNDMWLLIEKNQWASGMTCSITIDECEFSISHISADGRRSAPVTHDSFI